MLDVIAGATRSADDGTGVHVLPLDGRPRGTDRQELDRLAPLVTHWRQQLIASLRSHADWLESPDAEVRADEFGLSESWRCEGPTVFLRCGALLSAAYDAPGETLAEIEAAAQRSGSAAPRIAENYKRLVDAEQAMLLQDPDGVAQALATRDAGTILSAVWPAGREQGK